MVSCALLVEAQKKRPYTVLSLDGGGVRGLIPATVLESFEKFAYEYVTDPANADKFERTVPVNSTHKIVNMNTIFDMIAGTSTGSIIAGMISTPSDKDPSVPAYSAVDVVELYSTQGKKLFLSTAFPTWAAAVISLIGMIIFGILFFKIGMFYFDNIETYKDLKKATKRIKAI